MGSKPFVSSWQVPGSWLSLIAGLWLFGLLVMAIRLIRGYVLLNRCRFRSLPATTEDRLLLEQLRERMGVSRSVELRYARDLAVPMAAGLSRPVIFLPNAFSARLSEEEREQVILHELAHLARRDDWTQLGQRLIQTLLFFHPAVHWLSKRLSLVRELACDDWVVSKRGGKRKPYAACLLKVASMDLRLGIPAVEGSAVMFKSLIERRITLLLDGKRTINERVSPVRLMVGLVLLVLVGMVFVQLSPNVAVAQDSAAGSSTALALVDCEANGLHEGDISVASQADVDALAGIGFIGGSLTVASSEDLNLAPLGDLREISGTLNLWENPNLTRIDGFGCLQTVGGDLVFGDRLFGSDNDSLEQIAGFEGLTAIGGSIIVNRSTALTGLGGFGSLADIGGDLLIIQNPTLESVGEFAGLARVGGMVDITNNATLTSVGGFNALTTVGEDLQLGSNVALTQISGFDRLETVGSFFAIVFNTALTSIEGFSNLEAVPEGFGIENGDPALTVDGFYELEWGSAGFWSVPATATICPSFGLSTDSDPACLEP
jgi:beta-lactamase regulating signal transducer with metallopeptidase domain